MHCSKFIFCHIAEVLIEGFFIDIFKSSASNLLMNCMIPKEYSLSCCIKFISTPETNWHNFHSMRLIHIFPLLYSFFWMLVGVTNFYRILNFVNNECINCWSIVLNHLIKFFNKFVLFLIVISVHYSVKNRHSFNMLIFFFLVKTL